MRVLIVALAILAAIAAAAGASRAIPPLLRGDAAREIPTIELQDPRPEATREDRSGGGRAGAGTQRLRQGPAPLDGSTPPPAPPPEPPPPPPSPGYLDDDDGDAGNDDGPGDDADGDSVGSRDT